MKIAAAILALLVMLLSTQPMLMIGKTDAGEVCMKKKCCCSKDRCEKPKKQEDNKGCKGICSPFMPCTTCSYIMTERTEFPPSLLCKCVRAGRKPITFISHYHAEFWQPPEFI